jgi:hypothetical protein
MATRSYKSKKKIKNRHSYSKKDKYLNIHSKLLNQI